MYLNILKTLNTSKSNFSNITGFDILDNEKISQNITD